MSQEQKQFEIDWRQQLVSAVETGTMIATFLKLGLVEFELTEEEITSIQIALAEQRDHGEEKPVEYFFSGHLLQLFTGLATGRYTLLSPH